ncbi:MAG TPA: GNAT family N-acetyltransferase [Steroidobacteraceae bacterium]|nr:GNAT family N-acetyltransferase [Steroidobacteraceae bacterium]
MPAAEGDTIDVRHGTASFETEPPTLDDMCWPQYDILAKGLPWLVAVSDGHVVGYGYAGPYRPRAAHRDTVENSIYIHPDRTRRGIGGRLLPALPNECETRDPRQLIAVVGDSANMASIRLHERHGFRMTGVLHSVGYKHGKWLDSVLLQKSLGRGGTTPPSRS